MKQQIRLFFTAMMFYTRIPCPKNIEYNPDNINKATRFFPLIGWIAGGLSFLVFYVTAMVLNIPLAVLFSLVTGVLITGAFHEDGLADVFDGFGGGWTKERILEIMKDSRMGAYGVIALIFLFAIKFLSLEALFTSITIDETLLILLLFVNYHALSRLTAINMVFISTYSRDDATSKSKPIAKSHTSVEVAGAYIFGLIPLVALAFYQWQYVLVIIPLALLLLFSKRYFEKWIDGYTGDCLGAIEQIGECVSIITFLIIWKST